jgi:hypothetical protein
MSSGWVRLWRWNTGAPMDGVIRADPGWFTWGTHVMHRTGKVYSWHRMPRIYRMGVRQGINLYVVGAGLSAYYVGLVGTAAIYSALTLGILSLAVTLVVRRAQRQLRNRRTVTPLAAALGLKFGVAEAVAEKGLHFSKNWRAIKGGRLLVVDIPAHYAAVDGERQIIESVIGARLGRDIDCTWHTSKGKGGGTIDVRCSPPWPTVVKFMDYLDEIAKNKPGEYVVGVHANGTIERQSIKTVITPHPAFCFGSGYGKSSVLTSILGQLAIQDERNHFTILDTKMDSLEPLRGIPGFELYADPEHIEDMVAGAERVYEVMRYRQKAQQADLTLRGTWPIEGLVMEECNDFSAQLIAWWQRTGNRGNPLLWRDVIGPLLWQGRAVNVHVLAVAQNFLDRYFGNMSLRPSFQPMYMSGFKPAQYKSIVGTTPVIKSVSKVGRVLVTDGAREYWIQTLYEDQETLARWIYDQKTKPQMEVNNVKNDV